jgi:CRISPR-associated endonuclease/helicase Cas3
VPAPKKRGISPSDKRKSWPDIADFWAKTTKDGKPGISVRDHCLNVGCVAEALLSFLPSQLVPHGAVTLAALHDVGKISPGFQVECETWLLQHALQGRANDEGWCFHESDHAKVSQSTVQNLLHDTKLNRWAAAVGAHRRFLWSIRWQFEHTSAMSFTFV